MYVMPSRQGAARFARHALLALSVFGTLLVLVASSASAAGLPIQLKPGTYGVGHKTVLVITIDSVLGSGPAMTEEEARDAYFTGPTSANAFFTLQSAGLTTLTGIDRSDGDIVGPVSVPTVASCDLMPIATAANAAAVALGSNPADYDHVVYALPGVTACGVSGFGQFYGRLTWLNFKPGSGARTPEHELAHNFGVAHANTARCTTDGVPVVMSDDCTFVEYGDPFDAMGATSSLTSTYHRLQMGHLPPSWLAIANESGVHSLVSAEDFISSGPRLLMIPRKIVGQRLVEWFAVERRSRLLPFNTFAEDAPAATGFTIRWVNTSYGSTPNSTRLLDSTPSTVSFDDAPFLPGSSMTDPLTGVTISVSTSGGGPELSVDLPPLVDDYAPPAPSLKTFTPTADQVSMTWWEVIDDFSIDHYEVERNGATIASVNDLEFVDSDVPVGTHTYRVVAVDAGGNRSYSPTRTHTVAPPVDPDPEPEPEPTDSTGQPPTGSTPIPPPSPAAPYQPPAATPTQTLRPTISMKKKVKRTKRGFRLRLTITVRRADWSEIFHNRKLIDEGAGRTFRETVNLRRKGKRPKLVVRAENDAGITKKTYVLKP